MKPMTLRLLSALLALTLLAGMLPAALAAAPEPFSAPENALPSGESSSPEPGETTEPDPSPEPEPEPKPVPVASVSLDKSSLTLDAGETAALKASVQPDDAANRGVQWSSDRPEVASVSSTGVVTARAAGTATITVTTDDGGKTDSCTVTVREAVRPGVTVSPGSYTLAPGQSVALSAATVPQGQSVLWSSSDSSVAEVDPSTGRVTAKSPARQSTAVITATFNYNGANYRDACTVTVTPAAVPTLPQTAAVQVGKSVTLTVSGLPAGASVSWSGGTSALRLSGSSGASVTAAAGQLSGKSAVVSVTAAVTYGGQTTRLTCRVTVTPGAVQDITYKNIQPGQEQALRAQDFQSVCRAVYGHELRSVAFRKVTGGELLYSGRPVSLSSDAFSPSELGRLSVQAVSGSAGGAVLSYDAVDTDNNRYSGSVKLTLSGGSAGAVKYAAPAGGAALFRRDDFQSVCRAAAGGTLDYVTFRLPSASKGTLYHSFDSRAGTGTALRERDVCCYAPGRRDIGLDTVAFVPAKGFEGALSIPFDGRNTAGKRFSGTVELTIGTVGQQGDVTYKIPVNGAAALDDRDFSDLCRTAAGGSLDYIRFSQLPASSKGILYHKYGKTGQREAGRDTSYFRASSPYLDELTFVPARDFEGAVSIPFTGRNTAGKSFSGTLVIRVGSGTSASVVLEGETGRPVRFDSDPFQRFCREETGESLDYLAFDAPSDRRAGELRYRYGRSGEKAAGTGKYYRDGDPALSDLTFVPDSPSGAVSIPFTGRSTGGKSFSGAVSIRYAAPRAPEVVRLASDGTAVALRSADFTAAWAARGGKPLSSVRFTLPDSRSGRLYYDYTGPGRYRSAVTAEADYSLSGLFPLDKVVFQPRAEFSGVATISYTGTDAAGGLCQGVLQVTVTPPASTARFRDMAGYGWAVPGVEFMSAYGITTGTNDGSTFSPGWTMTRGDYVLMLVRAFGFTASGGAGFNDVPAGLWYSDALATARALGIIEADANGSFRPADPVTREDSMLFLYRAMQKSGRTLPGAHDTYLNRCPDGAAVSGYARSAMAALTQAGVIQGDQAGRLNPQSTLTRAEMAVILHRGLTL